MERRFPGLTMADVMRLAYQLAVRNGIKSQFCKRTEKTKRKWLKNCLRCHQGISVTTPEVIHSQKRGVSLLNQQLSIFKSTNPPCTPFSIILQDLTIATKPASPLYRTNTRKYIGIERQASHIFCSVRRTGISCDSRQLYESNWTLHSSVTGIAKKIYETSTDEWRTAWINPRVQSLGVDTERDFYPVVSSFHQTNKADKTRSCYLSTGRALFTHTRNLDR